MKHKKKVVRVSWMVKAESVNALLAQGYTVIMSSEETKTIKQEKTNQDAIKKLINMVGV